jgi:hypothetical protein
MVLASPHLKNYRMIDALNASKRRKDLEVHDLDNAIS